MDQEQATRAPGRPRHDPGAMCIEQLRITDYQSQAYWFAFNERCVFMAKSAEPLNTIRDAPVMVIAQTVHDQCFLQMKKTRDKGWHNDSDEAIMAKAAKTHAAFVAPAEQAIALQCLREHALLRQDLSAMESNIMDVRGSRHASTMVREKAKEVYDRVSNYVQEGEASKAKWYKALLRAEEGLKDYDRRFLMDDGQPNSWILPYVQQRDQALAAELPTIKQGMANLRQEVEGQMAAVMRDHKELEGRVQAMEALARDRKQRLASAWQEMRSSMDSASMDGTGQAEA